MTRDDAKSREMAGKTARSGAARRLSGGAASSKSKLIQGFPFCGETP
jgi:hypothetical protein